MPWSDPVHIYLLYVPLGHIGLWRWSDWMVARGTDEGSLRRWIMAGSQLACGIAIAGVFLAQSPLALTAWLILAGIAFGAISGNLYAVAQIFAGARGAGGWVGVQNTLGNLSGILQPIVTGLIVDRLGGFGWGFALAAGISAGGALWWWLAMPPIRQVEARAELAS